MADSTGAALVKVGGCVLGIIVLASALGGKVDQAVDDTTNKALKTAGAAYAGKKAIDAGANRLGGGGAPPPVGGGGGGSTKDRDRTKPTVPKPKPNTRPALEGMTLPTAPPLVTPTTRPCLPTVIPAPGVGGVGLTLGTVC